MIEVSDLGKSFNGQSVLKGVNAKFNDNEISCILGESGSGKSVFLQSLAGLIPPDSGHIYIKGVDIVNMNEDDLLAVRKQIGYLFQSGALFDFLNVFDNVAFPLKENTKFSQKEIEERVILMLKEVNLEEAKDKFPQELSGGMRKRVALARAMVLEPKVLFCDEPTSGLDPSRSVSISQLILKISKKYRSTTIIVSHDVQNSVSIADKVMVLDDGILVDGGSPQDFLSSKDKRIIRFLASYKEGCHERN